MDANDSPAGAVLERALSSTFPQAPSLGVKRAGKIIRLYVPPKQVPFMKPFSVVVRFLYECASNRKVIKFRNRSARAVAVP